MNDRDPLLKAKPATYRCPQCRTLHRRVSSKAWIKSYCSATGKNTRLTRQR